MSPARMQAIVELLDSGYALDPGAVRMIADWWLELLPTFEHPERVFCEMVNQLSESALANALLVGRLVVGEFPGLPGALRRACKRAGKIRPRRRAFVSDLLSSGAAVSVSAPSIVEVKREGEVVLTLTPDNTRFQDIPRLFADLHDIDQKGFNQRQLKIAVGDFVYASGLAIVAAWCAARSTLPSVDFADKKAEEYCRRIGFSEALGGSFPELVTRGDDWSLRLTPIVKTTIPERTASQMLEILDVFVAPSRDVRNALAVLLGELVENVHRHAEPKYPGFVVAQVYPNRLKLGITIADSGIGIPASFHKSPLPQYSARSLSDAAAVEEAIRPLVTSKPNNHSGYGLYVLAELIARNHGSFIIGSGKAMLTGYGRKGRLETESRAIAPWRGTVVATIIDLKEPLPLDEVYTTLPMPRGFNADDFDLE